MIRACFAVANPLRGAAAGIDVLQVRSEHKQSANDSISDLTN